MFYEYIWIEFEKSLQSTSLAIQGMYYFVILLYRCRIFKSHLSSSTHLVGELLDNP